MFFSSFPWASCLPAISDPGAFPFRGPEDAEKSFDRHCDPAFSGGSNLIHKKINPD